MEVFMSNKRKRQRSKKEWTVLINKFHASGLTRKEFCQQNNLSPEYFYRLERNFAKKDHDNQNSTPQTSFIPIEVSGSVADKLHYTMRDNTGLMSINSAIKINFANGISVEFVSGCSVSELSLVKDTLC